MAFGGRHQYFLSALDKASKLSHQLLCHTVEPVLDTVLFSLDAAGHVTFSEQGQIFLLFLLLIGDIADVVDDLLGRGLHAVIENTLVLCYFLQFILLV